MTFFMNVNAFYCVFQRKNTEKYFSRVSCKSTNVYLWFTVTAEVCKNDRLVDIRYQ